MIKALKTRNGYLHSNMVRFIIWIGFLSDLDNSHLHSNMVRFIMGQDTQGKGNGDAFTFQYG